ncbi:MAG: hypothetical protein KJ923_01300, partial [Candidatus Omnitrophica bacterium]|nr:hypothetical protein [Candidatus Omnitrophota bacterium]
VLIDTERMIEEMEGFIESIDLPTETRIFDINYAQVNTLNEKIQESVTKGVGSVKIDERTNKMAVTDFPEKIDEIAQLIKAFDEKTPQVLIDAQIIEISPSETFDVGIDWDYWIEKNFRMSTVLTAVTGTDKLSIGTNDVTPGKPGQYKAIIDMLRTIGETNILSSPRIMALNNQEAKILVGTKDAYITSTTSLSGDNTVTAQSVNFVDVGIKLFVTPTINNDGFVTMKIKPEVSSATRTDITSEGQITQVPIVTTSETETTVMIKDGVTIIIGGLKREQLEKTEKRIPIFGDIPFLGALFRSKTEEMNTTELVILLTPHIMSGESSFTEISQLQPKDGAIARMDDKGKIITEKIVTKLEAPEFTASSYYNFISEKVRKLALSNKPGGHQGRVKVGFTLSSKGILIDEPQVLETDNPDLNVFAIEAVKFASPFPAFPKSLEEPQQSFKIFIEYK